MTLLKPTLLDLKFKGERDYLHGTDIFDALTAVTGARFGIALWLYRIVRCGLEAVPLAAAPRRPREFAGLFAYHANDATRWVDLREDRAIEVLGRTPYDEDSVITDAVIEGGAIGSPGPSRYSFIERVVALNKVLLRRAVADVPWLFTRLELDRLAEAPCALRLRLCHRFGVRLIKSAIAADGAPLGFIYFSARNPSTALARTTAGLGAGEEC